MDAHVDGEQVLHSQASELLGVANTTVVHVEGLHAKARRWRKRQKRTGNMEEAAVEVVSDTIFIPDQICACNRWTAKLPLSNTTRRLVALDCFHLVPG